MSTDFEVALVFLIYAAVVFILGATVICVLLMLDYYKDSSKNRKIYIEHKRELVKYYKEKYGIKDGLKEFLKKLNNEKR